MNIKTILILLIAILAIVAGTLWFQFQSKKEKQASVNTISEALDQSIIDVPKVAPEVNAIKQVLPAGNPIEKTNPFKDEYKNPFE